MKPERTFSAQEGEKSSGVGKGPESIGHDIDVLCKMFDPDSQITDIYGNPVSDDSRGGISSENIRDGGVSPSKIEGLTDFQAETNIHMADNLLHLSKNQREKLHYMALGATKTEFSQNNGRLIINDTESVVYTLPSDVVHDDDYVHTDNNFTDNEKFKLENISECAQTNVIESISLDGVEIPVNDKNVNIDLYNNGYVTRAYCGDTDLLETDEKTDLVSAINELQNDKVDQWYLDTTITPIIERISLISEKEDISNKVTAISENSTHTEYPSAKCVYEIVGNIETAINGIIELQNKYIGGDE